jgi:hypothetical protein
MLDFKTIYKIDNLLNEYSGEWNNTKYVSVVVNGITLDFVTRVSKECYIDDNNTKKYHYHFYNVQSPNISIASFIEVNEYHMIKDKNDYEFKTITT